MPSFLFKKGRSCCQETCHYSSGSQHLSQKTKETDWCFASNVSHTHTHTHTHTQCKTTIFPLATWKVLQRNHTLIEAQVKPSTSMTWRSCQVWLQTTTVKQGSRYGESHQFSGFPVHIKVLLTLRCSLLRAQWHHAYVYTWLSPFAVHPDPSQQCLLTGYLKTKKKASKE